VGGCLLGTLALRGGVGWLVGWEASKLAGLETARGLELLGMGAVGLLW
jgi:hypothetical protein